MHTEDLKSFVEIGSALWADTDRSERLALETFTAAALLSLPEDRKLERAVEILMERAAREGNAGQTLANLRVMQEPLFRLGAEERLILSALHRGHWSYERLGRILKLEPEQIEEIAWKARLKLSEGKYPAGARPSTAHCPEYISSRPWTQKFLDEEFSHRDRLFLQNHLMACESCRRALGRCRDLYYSVEARLPQARAESVAALARVSQQAERITAPATITVGEAMSVFLKRWDVRLGLFVFLGWIGWKVFF